MSKEYIDRSATVDALNKLCDRVCQYSKAQRKVMCGACPLGDAFTVIEDDLPAADVVDGEAYRELLKAARKMHCWIFLNTADELDAYDECGLTDEMNALLGYGGQFTAKMDGGVNDG